jgi:Tfp pilus assembly protein PilX
MRTMFRPERLRGQEGAIIVIVMMFVVVFLIIGIALFVLIRSSNSGTEVERKDVKAFNVAEAGVDAAMAELKAGWPRLSTDPSVAVDPTEFRSLYSNATQFPDPSHGTFITSITYDNTPDNPTSVEANRKLWDSNGDDVMWIDSEADVDNDRHRILVQVKRLKIPVELPDVALVANTAGGNGQGLDVSVDPNYHGSIPEGGADVVYTGKGTFNKDVSPGANIEMITQPTNPFWSYVSPALIGNLREMALSAEPQSFFVNDAEAAGDFLSDPDTGPGSVVYLESTEEPIVIEGNTPMGSPAKPAILVIDTKNSGWAIDWRGTSQFYGVVIVVGSAELRGTNDIAGCVLSEGSVENKGGPGVKYNGDYIRRLNQLHTLSVAMVPNTWEEYTIPK